jgi:ADP-ribose pyrophosphatase
MAFDVIQSEMAFHGRAFSVRQDLVALPDGKQHLIDVIEHVGAVTLLPIDADGQIWFVRQYRHPVQQLILELPAGTMEFNEQPEATAGRRLAWAPGS